MLDDYDLIDTISIGNVKFMTSKDKAFTYEAYRTDLPNEPIAWINLTTRCVEVHTAVSVEKYQTLDEAAKAIEQYR